MEKVTVLKLGATLLSLVGIGFGCIAILIFLEVYSHIVNEFQSFPCKNKPTKFLISAIPFIIVFPIFLVSVALICLSIFGLFQLIVGGF